MGTFPHIIHRVNLEIEAPDLQTGNRIQEEAVLLLKNEILPELERYLDSLELGDEFIQVNRLNLEMKNITDGHFESEFAGYVLRVFSEKIEVSIAPQAADEDTKILRYTGEQLAFESFLFFLKTGRLPWWNSKSGELLREGNLVKTRFNSPELRDRLVSLLQEDETALQRLLLQYSGSFVLQIISSFLGDKTDVEREEITEVIQQLLQRFEANYLFASFSYHRLQLDFLRRIIQKIISREEIFSIQIIQHIFEEVKSKVLSEKKEKTGLPVPEKSKNNLAASQQPGNKKQEPSAEGIFVQHAGLVLLHPFLEYYFMDFDLLKEGQFKDNESQTFAIHLLHYLATKQELAAEYELVLEKFLCGWDLDLPIAREVSLSKEMKDEGERLLSATIKHWNALKNTSPDGLREGFLQRDGKLIPGDFQDRLVVESKAQDVLLSFLPWGYSIFKLPWKESALYVEWQQLF